MYEIQCFDPYGAKINTLTQWDVDQSLVIPIDSLNVNNIFIRSSSEVNEDDPVASYDTPEVHFSNHTRSEALVVPSSSDDGKSIKVKIPNILLQEPYPLQVYVYATYLDDTKAQKTILHNEIPIRKRQKPSDSEYIPNIESSKVSDIVDEISYVVSKTSKDAEKAINDKKTDSISAVESVKTTAINNINTAASNAITEVNNQMNENYNEGSITVDGIAYTGGFVNVGNDILNELKDIKNASQDEYDANLVIAEQTQAAIEADAQQAIYNEGISIDTRHDESTGNVDVLILFDKQTAFIL